MTRIESRVRRLEDRERNPFANDPRMAALAAPLQAGGSIRTFSDDELNHAIAWCKAEGRASRLDVASMTDDDFDRAMDGDESVLACYRTVAW